LSGTPMLRWVRSSFGTRVRYRRRLTTSHSTSGRGLATRQPTRADSPDQPRQICKCPSNDLVVRVGFAPSSPIDNTELIDSALLQMLQMHKMLYIITPDYTQADDRSPAAKGYWCIGVVRVKRVVGAGGLDCRRSYVHQAESYPSSNTFRHAIGVVFAHVVLEPLEAHILTTKPGGCCGTKEGSSANLPEISALPKKGLGLS
jgi:hypothetical protein